MTFNFAFTSFSFVRSQKISNSTCRLLLSGASLAPTGRLSINELFIGEWIQQLVWIVPTFLSAEHCGWIGAVVGETTASRPHHSYDPV